MHRRSTPCLILFVISCVGICCRAQSSPADAISPEAAKPLPDVPTLMRQVEVNQRKAEALEQNYIYDEAGTFTEQDSHGATKKTDSREFEIFWLNDVRVARLVKKDGKPLSADELKKENDRIDNVVKKAKERRDKADAEGKETDSHGHDEITVSRMLELGTFSNPRREMINGRDTIEVDYAGDPKAKTHNAAEGAFKELARTIWVDEADQQIQHLEGHFNSDFKVGGGLLVDVRKGTWFKASNVKVNDEVWLPQTVEADGHARYLLFFSLNGHFLGNTSDYRKFKATSTLLPGVTPVEPEPPSAAPSSTPPSR
jgi:hypothetical protein